MVVIAFFKSAYVLSFMNIYGIIEKYAQYFRTI